MEKIVLQYNEDIKKNKGYIYTTNAKKSSILANERLTKLTLESVDLKNKKVLDIGCGDGTYTNQLLIRSQPELIVGVDVSSEAIKLASKKYVNKKMVFKKQDCYNLLFDEKFDAAILRGVLHHLENPLKALEQAKKVSKTLLIIEPNGNNPVLKIIEETSRYHLMHQEKSFNSLTIKKWIKKVGGKIVFQKYAGFVPFFCPDWMALIFKKAEPLIENLPIIKNFACAVYCLKIVF